MLGKVAGAAVVVGVGLGLTGCGWSGGPEVTQERSIGEVTAVELKGSGDLTVLRGSTPSLTVTAGERHVDDLTSEVRDGVLVLDQSRRWVSSGGTVRYTLVVGELDRIEVKGSGDVTGSGVTGDDLVVSISGSGDVRLDEVSADDVTVSVSGSGSVELSGAATEAAVSIEGSGDVRLPVSDKLTASIKGSGSVRYAGDPEVVSDVRGSGEVRSQ